MFIKHCHGISVQIIPDNRIPNTVELQSRIIHGLEVLICLLNTKHFKCVYMLGIDRSLFREGKGGRRIDGP